MHAGSWDRLFIFFDLIDRYMARYSNNVLTGKQWYTVTYLPYRLGLENFVAHLKSSSSPLAKALPQNLAISLACQMTVFLDIRGMNNAALEAQYETRYIFFCTLLLAYEYTYECFGNHWIIQSIVKTEIAAINPYFLYKFVRTFRTQILYWAQPFSQMM